MNRTARLVILVALVATFLVPAPRALAAGPTCVVDPGGGGDYLIIQDAIDDANCDQVSIVAGTFHEALTITRSVFLHGAMRDQTVLDGQNALRPIDISGTNINVTISDLTVTNGLASGPGGDGGGIRAVLEGTLTIVNAAVTNSTGVYGGGLFLFSTNGDIHIQTSNITGNTATGLPTKPGVGGGLDVTVWKGEFSTYSVYVADNTSFGRGGGMTIAAGDMFLLESVSVSVEASTFSENTAGTDGGGISVHVGNGTALFRDLDAIDNTAGGAAGGIDIRAEGESIDVVGATVSGNHAADAGGIRAFADLGEFRIADSTVSDNSTPGDYGGIEVSVGGIFGPANAVIENTTISGNFAAGDGGGVGGSTLFGGVLDLDSVTIAANAAVGSGGGVKPGGGALPGEDAVFRVRNSIIAGNGATSGPDCSGPVVSLGHNLVRDGTGRTGLGASGDIIGTSAAPIDPRLEPLALNGGSTRTHELMNDSPAVDAGATGLGTDQRWMTRPAGFADDIGAFELHNEPPVADADGPYEIFASDALELDGSYSYDPDNDSLEYSWFLGPLLPPYAGPAPTIPWADLASLPRDVDITVLLWATDGLDKDADSTTLRIVNRVPTADPNGPYVIHVGEDLLLDGSASDDPDGDALTFAWEVDSLGPYEGPNDMTTVPWADLAGFPRDTDIPVRLTVDDGYATNTGSTSLRIVNRWPTADADGPYEGFVGEDLVLDGSASWDPDGNDLSYEWSVDGIGPYFGVAPTIPWADLTGLTRLTPHTVSLTVTDPIGASDDDATTLTIVNRPPVSDPGGPYVVEFGTGTLNLDGSGSSDPDGDPLTYSWFLDPPTVDATGVTPVPFAWADLVAHGIDTLGPQEIHLGVEDPYGAKDTQPGTVGVVDTTPPECEADLIPIQVTVTQGEFMVSFSCTDLADPEPSVKAGLNGVRVEDEQFVELITFFDEQVVFGFWGEWIIKAPEFVLTVVATDASDNETILQVQPVFTNTTPPVGPPSAPVLPPNTPPPSPPPSDWPPADPPPPSAPLPAAPDDCTVELTKLHGYWNQGTFRIEASCVVDVDSVSLDINGYEVTNGQMIELVKTWGTERTSNMWGSLRMEAPEFLLTLTTTGPDGTWTATPDF